MLNVGKKSEENDLISTKYKCVLYILIATFYYRY